MQVARGGRSNGNGRREVERNEASRSAMKEVELERRTGARRDRVSATKKKRKSSSRGFADTR